MLVSLVSPPCTGAPGPLRLNQRKISVFAFIPCSRLNAEHGTKLDTGYIIRVTRRHSAERRVVIDITFMRDHTPPLALELETNILRSFHSHEEGPIRAWLKVLFSAFTFKTLIRHYAKQMPKHSN